MRLILYRILHNRWGKSLILLVTLVSLVTFVARRLWDFEVSTDEAIFYLEGFTIVLLGLDFLALFLHPERGGARYLLVHYGWVDLLAAVPQVSPYFRSIKLIRLWGRRRGRQGQVLFFLAGPSPLKNKFFLGLTSGTIMILFLFVSAAIALNYTARNKEKERSVRLMLAQVDIPRVWRSPRQQLPFLRKNHPDLLAVYRPGEEEPQPEYAYSHLPVEILKIPYEGLVFVISRKDVTAPMDRLEAYTLIASMLSIISIILVASLFIDRFIIRRLRALGLEMAALVAEDSLGIGETLKTPVQFGDPPVSFSAKEGWMAGDEIDDLMLDFHVLSHNLKSAVSSLRDHMSMEEDLRIARGIQEKLLISASQARISGRGQPGADSRTHQLDIAMINQSASTVGGDLYEFRFLDDRFAFLMIGDVSGKGTPASLFMSAALFSVRAVLNQRKILAGDTEEALRQITLIVNQTLYENNRNAMFVTALLAVLDRETNQLSLVSCGHEPLLIVPEGGGPRGDGEETRQLPGLEKWKPAGPPLGILDRATLAGKLEVSTRHLNVGDLLVFFTDGITDAVNPQGEFFGPERFYQLVRETGRRLPAPAQAAREKSGETPANQALRALLAGVMDFQKDAPSTDDLTLMVVRID